MIKYNLYKQLRGVYGWPFCAHLTVFSWCIDQWLGW